MGFRFWGAQARKIKTRAVVNDSNERKKMRGMKAEIEHLREQLAALEKARSSDHTNGPRSVRRDGKGAPTFR